MKASLQLPGYEVGPVLRRSGERVVYHARRLADDATVAIETLDVEYPNRQQVARIRREGAIVQGLAGCLAGALIPTGAGFVALGRRAAWVHGGGCASLY